LFECVLVPVDGSSNSVAAMNTAVKNVRRYGGSITAVHVVDKEVVRQLARFEDKEGQLAQRELEENGRRYLGLASDMGQREGVNVETVLRRGEPYLEIVNEARARRASLIILGRLGGRGPRRILIGSVTERVIEYAECPVLVTIEEEDQWRP